MTSFVFTGTPRAVVLAAFVSLSATMACSAETAAPESSDDDVVAPESADAPEPVQLARSEPFLNSCSGTIEYAQLSRATAATKAINTALRETSARDSEVFKTETFLPLCFDLNRTGRVTGRMTIQRNGGGLFSALERVDYFDTTKTEKLIDARIRSMTFDLKTGARLTLREVLDDAGLAKARALCVAPASKLSTGNAQAECGAASDAIAASYLLEREGLRLFPFMKQAQERGVLVPWSELRAHVTHPAVAKLASPAP
jgi:hypothetical protein